VSLFWGGWGELGGAAGNGSSARAAGGVLDRLTICGRTGAHAGRGGGLSREARVAFAKPRAAGRRSRPLAYCANRAARHAPPERSSLPPSTPPHPHPARPRPGPRPSTSLAARRATAASALTRWRAAPSPSPMAACTAASLARPSSTRRRAPSWGCTPLCRWAVGRGGGAPGRGGVTMMGAGCVWPRSMSAAAAPGDQCFVAPLWPCLWGRPTSPATAPAKARAPALSLSHPPTLPPSRAVMPPQRPMVVGKSIEARPMMYVALTYDHRLIDGREVGPTGGEGIGGAGPRALPGSVARVVGRRRTTTTTRPAVRRAGPSPALPTSGQCLRQPSTPHCAPSALRHAGPLALWPQAVTFLKRIKEVVEDPRRLLLNV
jgi:hypothetical protein